MIDKTEFLAKFEEYFARLLDGNASPLNDVARYCALDGGKRLRPTCVYLGALAAGGDVDVEQLLSLAAGVELVHCYSLVHDDLPAMDDGKLRRGKPCAHIAFGEANAILGGDILLSFAFEVLTKGCARYGARYAAAAAELSSAAVEMAHGQALELEGIRGKDDYLAMCQKKTGALILGSLKAGALAAGADDRTYAKISEYGRALGLLFQISDDILDGDGLVFIVGKEEAALELELRLLQAVNAAQSVDRSLVDFALKISSRKK